MEETITAQDNHTKKTIITEGWKYLGTTDGIEVWAKNKDRIKYCLKTQRIIEQYTSEIIV